MVSFLAVVGRYIWRFFRRLAIKIWRNLKEAFTSPRRYICSKSFDTLFKASYWTCPMIFGITYFAIGRACGRKPKFVDCLYLGTSMQTNTGLNPVNLKDVGFAEQLLMLCQMELGSHRFISILILSKRWLEGRRIRQERFRRSPRRQAPWFGSNTWHSNSSIHDVELRDLPNQPDGRFSVDLEAGLGGNDQSADPSTRARELLEDFDYYCTSFLLCFVFIVELLLLGAAIAMGVKNEDTADTGLNPRWVGIYTMLSGLQNNGSNLLPYGMASFATNKTTQWCLGFLMLAGNTCLPILLHLLIWLQWLFCNLLGKRSKKRSGRADRLAHLLEDPRRNYLFVYPIKETIRLAFSIFILILCDLIAFLLLTIPLKFSQDIPTGQWVLNGFFQCLALRTTGYTIVGISSMPGALQAITGGMLYLSMFPTVISMRSSNKLQQRALGIFSADADNEAPKDDLWQYITQLSPSDRKYLRQQVQKVQAYDMETMLGMGLLILVCEMFTISPETAFAAYFEVLSATRNVGVSMGVPSDGYSCSGSWNPASKIVLCFAMILGKLRCLPAATDMATIPHGEEEAAEENLDAQTRAQRAQFDVQRAQIEAQATQARQDLEAEQNSQRRSMIEDQGLRQRRPHDLEDELSA